MGLNIPLIEVNHMQAHILANFIDDEFQETPNFPFIGVNISGGHTQILIVKNYFDMEIIGETLDDAIGEAFDKCGKKLDWATQLDQKLINYQKWETKISLIFLCPRLKLVI